MKKSILLIITILSVFSCKNETQDIEKQPEPKPFNWKAANIYFLLTDRFKNANPNNDLMYGRKDDAAKLRGYMGGDLKGVTQKISEGYFNELGVNAIWMTPIVENIHSGTDEGTGKSYGFHGYWTKDWTAIDANLGTEQDLKALVDTAHSKGLRVVLDAVINHTGPVTEIDPVWPSDWVRTEPQCEYTNYENTVTCTLVKNLPDIRTDSNEHVELPPHLIQKWKSEGRYDQEIKELDAFFQRTGHPRAPRFYIMKWLTDYIKDYGIDGYRCDTVKHTEPYVWEEFKTECDYAFSQFKKNNPNTAIDATPFYLVGEIYNYGISGGKHFDFGDKKVNFFDGMFSSQINFEFKWNAKQMTANAVFNKYNNILQNELKGFSVLNYMSSHDDGQPFDQERKMPYKTAELLFLTPGASQIYYGDEIARELVVDGAIGDANLRSPMDWNKANIDEETQKILSHWQKLGQFTAKHPSVGAGKHQLISEANGLVFSRVWKTDKVVVAMNLSQGEKTIPVAPVFNEGDILTDFYSGKEMVVTNDEVKVDTPFNLVLLESTLSKN